MKSEEIRKTFLRYFEGQGHKIMPSASLIPSDPSVLLTLAGMLPFKPIFLGQERPKWLRATSAQKCIRTNDIERVGKTSRHHTFFEMLGNFSFNDYFKKEAVDFAWELLTRVFALSPEKLVVAVYEKDEETAQIWKKRIGLPDNKIYRLSEENNFWAAGPTGPCGPCSEIYYDYGPEAGCGKPDCDPSCDCERFLEVWNLVFIEFNRDEAGKLNPLPSKNIDTGMGLERIARLLQKVKTNFDTDLFAPIMRSLPKGDEISRRIVADHLRAAVYLIGDGVLPSNESRGYVLRRIIRRAALHGKKLGMHQLFLSGQANLVIDLGKNTYPELSQRKKVIEETLRTEESYFEKTLEAGLKLVAEVAKKHGRVWPGEEVFKLHDTYGFPIEMTREIAIDSGATIDEEGFRAALTAQRERARAAKLSADQLRNKIDLTKFPKTNFIGYNQLDCESKVIAVWLEEKMVILDKTPFYPEGGGQVGDTGIINVNDHEILVLNTLGEINGVIVHQVDRIEGIEEKKNVKVKIDASKRSATAGHHTATHLLHAALRSVLGPEARQAGSLVAPDRLRFDFKQAKALSLSELDEIERFVNEKIRANLKVEIQETSLEEAQKQGAVALFGEKYGKKVRMVKIPGVSLELCGGTHVKNTGEIGFFKIVKEEALQAGIRRILAVAGASAKIWVVYQGKGLRDGIYRLMRQHQLLQAEKEKQGGAKVLEAGIFEIDQEELERLSRAVDHQDIVNVNKFLEHLRGRVEWLKERNLSLEKEIAKLEEKQVLESADKLLSDIQEIKGIKVLVRELPEVSLPNLRSLSDKLRAGLGSGILILASIFKDKVSFLVTVSDDLTGRYNAGSLVKILAETCGGGGGGKANKAEAGGRDPSRVKEAINKVLESL
jgi:alanyl-tRNA synthetase